MERYYVSTLLWVKFCENYPDIRDVIRWICKKTNKEWLYDHLFEKFKYLCGNYTCHGVMNVFYCDIDKDLRDALVEYAIKVWSPEGMSTTFEANKELLGL